MKKRYWIGWYNLEEDWVPWSQLNNVPPIESVLGYWCTGSAWIPSRKSWSPTMVAAIDEYSVAFAMQILEYEWPCTERMLESHEDILRFVKVKDPDYMPSDRFPLYDWMRPRFTTPANLKK